MSLNLLIDLDDTLLKNNFEDFLPHYLDLFSETVADTIEPKRFVKALLHSTRMMFENHQPDCTLMEVFKASFLPSLNIEQNEFIHFADKFYKEKFPELQYLTEVKTDAVKLVKISQNRGYKISISTNPLFPYTAIEQRLNWAGLSPTQYTYEIISSYEKFHFAKPNPAYFAELMAQIGWPSGQVLVIGDDLKRDIDSAGKLGLPTYWVTPDSVTKPVYNNEATASGPLSQLLDWLDSTPEKNLEPDYSSPDAMMAILKSTPAALDTYRDKLYPEDWNRQPSADEWAVNQIMCHLRDVDREVNYPRIVRIKNEENPFISGIDTDRWAGEKNYIDQDGDKALEEFISVRIKILNELEELSFEDWGKKARHTIFGPTSIGELVSIITAHDRLHIQQLYKLTNWLMEESPGIR